LFFYTFLLLTQPKQKDFKNHNPDPEISKIPIRIQIFQKFQSGSRDFKNPNPDQEISKIYNQIKRF